MPGHYAGYYDGGVRWMPGQPSFWGPTQDGRYDFGHFQEDTY